MKRNSVKMQAGKLKKILAIILFLFWAALLLGLSANCLVKKYVYPLEYKRQVYYYADYYALDRALIFSVIKVESSFDNTAKSNAGALGLMQITEDTGKYIAQKLGERNYDLYNPETNVKFGCYYIKYLCNRFEKLETALCAYNAGEGNVSAWLLNEEYSDDGKTLKSIPFKETEDYIAKIKKTFSKYKKLYGNILDK